MNDAVHKVLNLRPTNAAMRLGPSWLPLLNPRDLQRALADRSAALLTAPSFSRAAIPGLLRAARHADAAMGISCPYPLGERDRPDSFAAELIRAADEVPHRKPFFLQAGPIPLRSSEDRALEQLEVQLFKYIEAGCSLISFDASALELAAAAKTVARLSQPAAERELSVEVAALRESSGAPSLTASRKLLETLSAVGLQVKYLRADARSLVYDNELRPERVRELSDIAVSQGAQLCVDDTVGLDHATIRACVDAGARKWDATESFARRVVAALPKGALEALQKRASEVGRPWTELLGALSEGLSAPEDDLRVKLEALAYEEATVLFGDLSARGTGSAAVSFLAENAGY